MIARTWCLLETPPTLLHAQITNRVETLRTSAFDEERKRLSAEAQEFRARKLLAKHLQLALDEIERKSRYAAYGLCIDDTRDAGDYEEEYVRHAQSGHAETQGESSGRTLTA